MITHELSIESYHASKRVSASKLKTFAGKGARAYYAAHEQRAWSEADTQAYRAGRAIEDALQRPVDFRAKYIAKPEGMSFATREGKAWRAEQAEKGLEILESQDARASEALLETLEHCPTSQALMGAAEAQPTIVHEQVKRWAPLPGLQARPDWMCADGCAESEWLPFTLDLKTTATLDMLASWRTITRFGYHKQAGMMRLCLELEGVDVSCWRHLLLGAEKSFPYRWRVFELPTALVLDGYRWCVEQLGLLAEHYATGEWPLVEGEIVTVQIPPWVGGAADNDPEDGDEDEGDGESEAA